jgi:RNA polymerase-associated protein CTR9
MNHREKAKAAWERSVEMVRCALLLASLISHRFVLENPSEWSGQLLLGLDALNASKNPDLSEDDRIQELMIGSKLIERAFNSNQRNASAANALCDIFLRKGQYKRVRLCCRMTLAGTLIEKFQALKLAERTIQFADTMAVLTDGHIHAGRVCHAEGSYSDALKHYKQATEGQSKNVPAAIGFAQMQLRDGRLFSHRIFSFAYES